MAFKIVLVVCSVIAAASAGFTYAGFDENGRAVSGIYPIVSSNMQMPRMPSPIQFPQFPGFANFPNFPQFHMPAFQFPQIHIPSPDEIVNVKPAPGQTFHGIAVSSDDRGTRVTTNKDGTVQHFEVDGSDEQKNPNSNEVPPKPSRKYVGKNLHKTAKKMPKYEHIKFEMPKLKVYTSDEIKDRVPDENEHFVGFSKSTFTSTSTVNGKTSSAGGSETVENNNGAVKVESVRVGQEDKD